MEPYVLLWKTRIASGLTKISTATFYEEFSKKNHPGKNNSNTTNTLVTFGNFSSIFLLVVQHGIDGIMAKSYIPQKSWFHWICSKSLCGDIDTVIFDLHVKLYSTFSSFYSATYQKKKRQCKCSPINEISYSFQPWAWFLVTNNYVLPLFSFIFSTQTLQLSGCRQLWDI